VILYINRVIKSVGWKNCHVSGCMQHLLIHSYTCWYRLHLRTCTKFRSLCIVQYNPKTGASKCKHGSLTHLARLGHAWSMFSMTTEK